MYQKYFMISAVLFSLTACMSSNVPSQLTGADSTAKIRVFQQADVTLYPGEHCYGSNNPRAIHAAESGFSIFGTHKRAGMPVTEDISSAYNEYVIQAGTPLTVMLQWTEDKGGMTSSCGPLGSTFFPQAGKNYDVSLLGSADHCMLQVRELYETAPGKAVAKLAPVSPSLRALGNSPACKVNILYLLTKIETRDNLYLG